jgi:inosine/xanthosine triphosphatase
MKKVIVTSKNPVKLEAVKIGFTKMFPDETFEFSVLSVSSGVPDQPNTNEETYRGARNRVDNAFAEMPGADFYVGVEGGIELVNDEMECFAWVAVRSGDKYSKAKTGTFYLPNEVVRLIKEGKELGEADDIVFKKENSKQQNGAVGILTGDVLNRTDFYIEAIIFSLIPFKNPGLY